VPQSSPVPQFASVSESSKFLPLPSTPFGSQVRTAESQSLERALSKRRELPNTYQSEVLREGDIFVDLKTRLQNMKVITDQLAKHHVEYPIDITAL